MNDFTKKSNILICGMHRSGTSLTARLIESCGYHFGAQSEMMNKDIFNEDGYWERKDIVKLNSRLLSFYGSSWDYPIEVPKESLREIAINNIGNFTLHAKNIISKMDYPFAIKDPRISITLPFWMELIENKNIIIVVRNPIEVARSLARRNGISKNLGLMLWYKYYRCIYNYTNPEDRHYIFHEELIRKDVTLIRKISNMTSTDVEKIEFNLLNSINEKLVSSNLINDISATLDFPAYQPILDLWFKMKKENQDHHFIK